MKNGTSFTLELLIQISVLVYGEGDPSEGLQNGSVVLFLQQAAGCGARAYWFTQQNVLLLEAAL